jgi:prevent-host-death family protein
MPTIGAREANRSFSKILREAESGKTVTITRNGKPIAQLGPLAISPLRSKNQRKKSLERLMGLLEKGYDLGGGPYSRDDMHER